MEPFRYHVFACTQEKPEGHDCCSRAGSQKILDVLNAELQEAGLFDEVQVSGCGCLGLCEGGPVMIVYPEGTWYTNLTPVEVPQIVRSHFAAGRTVEHLVRTDWAAMKTEMLDHRNKYLAMLKAKAEAAAVAGD